METNLCVAGFGGQGVMTLGKFLASATCDSTDKNVTFFPSYGAEQRGGTANCFVVISDEMVGAPLGDVMDDLIVMNGPSLQKFLPTLKQGWYTFHQQLYRSGRGYRQNRRESCKSTGYRDGSGNGKCKSIKRNHAWCIRWLYRGCISGSCMGNHRA